MRVNITFPYVIPLVIRPAASQQIDTTVPLEKRNSNDVDVGYSSVLHARMRDRSIRNLNGRVNASYF